MPVFSKRPPDNGRQPEASDGSRPEPSNGNRPDPSNGARPEASTAMRPAVSSGYRSNPNPIVEMPVRPPPSIRPTAPPPEPKPANTEEEHALLGRVRERLLRQLDTRFEAEVRDAERLQRHKIGR